jgi:hypothetical protein
MHDAAARWTIRHYVEPPMIHRNVAEVETFRGKVEGDEED